MTAEQDIDLSEGSVLHFRNEHPRQDGAEECSAGPDVAALAAQVPLVAVQHVAGEENAGDVDQVVGAAADAGGEGTEADGGRFADDDPRRGTKGVSVCDLMRCWGVVVGKGGVGRR